MYHNLFGFIKCFFEISLHSSEDYFERKIFLKSVKLASKIEKEILHFDAIF